MHTSGSQNFIEFHKLIHKKELDGVSLTERQAAIDKALDDFVADLGTLSKAAIEARFQAIRTLYMEEFPVEDEQENTASAS
jgi:hypothetical protein